VTEKVLQPVNALANVPRSTHPKQYYGDEIGSTSRGQCKVCRKDELTLVCNNLDQVMENRAGDLWREYQARRKKRLERYSDDSDRVRHLI
jgi:hypothetical protein